MNENEVINAFLSRTDLNETELVVAQKCKILQDNFNTVSKELQEARQAHMNKEADFVRIRSYLELNYSLILDLARATAASNAVETVVAE